MNIGRAVTSAAVFLALGVAPCADGAVEEETRGRAIAQEMKQRERGFGNYTAELQMVLIDANGKERIRALHVATREVPDDGDQSLAVFDAPADVKGTAFLSHTHIGRDDDQWLYLPSLKRVKRISPRNKTAPFMGSEFTYEDLASIEVEEFSYRYIGEEEYEGKGVFVVDRIPVDPFSGYARQRVWVERERYLTLKTEYFDRNAQRVKTLIVSDFRLYLGRFWRAHTMRMDHHPSGKTSVLSWDSFAFRQPLGETDFLPQTLERVR